MDTYRSIITDILFQGRRNGFWSGEQAPRFDHGLRQGEKKLYLAKKCGAMAPLAPCFAGPVFSIIKWLKQLTPLHSLSIRLHSFFTSILWINW